MRGLLRFLLIALAASAVVSPLRAQETFRFTRADTLRGSDGPGRSWWDATFYDLHVTVDPSDSTITGWNGITYRVLKPGTEMQIDLQTPLEVDSVVQNGRTLSHHRDGNAVFVEMATPQRPGETHTVDVHYGGKPVVAVRPPWDGGFIWETDDQGRPWVATANQGLGASVWWPNKDLPSEEPDSQRISMTVPDPMVDISNGRLRSTVSNGDGTTTYEWFVTRPINNYGIAVNAGTYAHWTEHFEGERGTLTMDYWPLAANLEAARRQWVQARTTMACFEHWFGPYPWYEDGFKLVEAPHLGMEHQSAVAYGNGYRNGYRGTDLSGTGLGMEWDFIIVHETAHEWWGNNISVRDGADLWVHESFANYSETLYTECLSGDPIESARYVIGTRSRILNDRPIQGYYGVNDQGSGDKYYKGGNMLHTIRQVVGDDDVWRSMLRGLNELFRHQVVTGAQVEAAMSAGAGIDLSGVFDQYLRTTMVPVLEYRTRGTVLGYRWSNVVPGFHMPVKVTWGEAGGYRLLQPTAEWQSLDAGQAVDEVRADPSYYVTVERAGGG